LTVSLEARGRALLRRREFDDAEKLFEEAAARPDASAMAPYGLAVLRHFQSRRTGGSGPMPEGLATQIEGLLLKALALDPEFAPALARLADLYHRTDQEMDRSIAMVRRAQGKAPEHEDYRFLEARILRKFGQHEAARKIIAGEVARAAADQSRNLDNDVCWDGNLSGFAAEVMPACERAVARFPESGNSIDSRGLAKALTGDLAAARADLKKALQLADSSWNDQVKALRREWLAAIEKGADPFAGMSSPLIDDPSLGEIGWWR
jgi:tetratricopeptide (TPR) repeat protein